MLLRAHQNPNLSNNEVSRLWTQGQYLHSAIEGQMPLYHPQTRVESSRVCRKTFVILFFKKEEIQPHTKTTQ